MDFFAQKGHKKQDFKNLNAIKRLKDQNEKEKQRKRKRTNVYNSVVYGGKQSKRTSEIIPTKEHKEPNEYESLNSKLDFQYLLNQDELQTDHGLNIDALEEFGVKGLDDKDDVFGDVNKFLQDDSASNIKNKTLIQNELQQINKNIGNESLVSSDDEDLDDLRTTREQKDTIETFQKFFENDTDDITKTLEKYPNDMYKKYHKKFPTIMNHGKLIQRSSNIIKTLIPKIIAKSADSVYYNNALDIYRNSNKPTLSSKDLSTLDWDKFSAGYFGSDVQQTVAKQIAAIFKGFHKYQKYTEFFKVRDFWGEDFFNLYVLAPEITAHMAKEDFKIPLNEAYTVLKDTIDYGRFVVDRGKQKQMSKPVNSKILDNIFDDSEGDETIQKKSENYHKDIMSFFSDDDNGEPDSKFENRNEDQDLKKATKKTNILSNTNSQKSTVANLSKNEKNKTSLSKLLESDTSEDQVESDGDDEQTLANAKKSFLTQSNEKIDSDDEIF